MGWLNDWLESALATAPVLSVVGWLIGRRRGKADIQKVDSESGKIGVEAAQIIAETATALLVPMSERMGKLEARIEVLETENEHKTKLLDSAIRFIRKLLGWIEHHAPGETPPVIPTDLATEVEE